MRKMQDLTGQKFERLTAVTHKPPTVSGKKSYWLCRCDCGEMVSVDVTSLLRGHTRSCGCIRIRHGHTSAYDAPSPTYVSWKSMLARCLNPSSPAFVHYQKRGITVCERWRVFDAFLADMGTRPDGTSLDRIDNNGHYEPGNCRWATKREQGNNRTTNQVVEYRGQRYTIAELARATGVSKDVLRARLVRSKRWTVEDAVHSPALPATERRKPRA